MAGAMQPQGLLSRGVVSRDNLPTEWGSIENMVDGGITPSCQRLKEYLQASCTTEECKSRVEQVLICIADILRLEEEKVCRTDPVLRQLLVLLESDISGEQLKLALAEIEVSPQEPEDIS